MSLCMSCDYRSPSLNNVFVLFERSLCQTRLLFSVFAFGDSSYRRHCTSQARLYQMGRGDCILVLHDMHVQCVTVTRWPVSCCS